jgi:hypothetical protein
LTQDEIIEMLAKVYGVAWTSKAQLRDLTAFAKLVAQHEREACARVCELMWHEWLDSPEENEPNKPDAEDCYRAIRARGQA